jgi:hypothetical protein
LGEVHEAHPVDRPVLASTTLPVVFGSYQVVLAWVLSGRPPSPTGLATVRETSSLLNIAAAACGGCGSCLEGPKG